MAKNYNGNKYDVQILIDPVTQAKSWIPLSNIKVSYGDGQFKELSSVLTEHEEKTKRIIELEANQLKLKTSLKNTLKIVEVLASQLSINNTEVLDLIHKNTMEE